MAFFEQILSVAAIVDYLEVYGPSTKKELQGRLKEKELKYSDRTFERLKNTLRYQFGIELVYRDKRYWLDKSNQIGTERLNYLLTRFNQLEAFQEEFNHPEIKNRIIHSKAGQSLKMKWVPLITKAILDQTCIKFQYTRLSSVEREVKEFFIEPYLLKETELKTFLIGKPRADRPRLDKIRAFNVAQIEVLEVTQDQFEFSDYQRLYTMLSNRMGIARGDGTLSEVRLRVSSPLHYEMNNQPIHDSQETEELNEEFGIFKLRIEINLEFKRFLMRNFTEIKILAPRKLYVETHRGVALSLKENFELITNESIW